MAKPAAPDLIERLVFAGFLIIVGYLALLPIGR